MVLKLQMLQSKQRGLACNTPPPVPKSRMGCRLLPCAVCSPTVSMNLSLYVSSLTVCRVFSLHFLSHRLSMWSLSYRVCVLSYTGSCALSLSQYVCVLSHCLNMCVCSLTVSECFCSDPLSVVLLCMCGLSTVRIVSLTVFSAYRCLTIILCDVSV